MPAAPAAPVVPYAPQGDLAGWATQIDQALTTPDPVLANLRITLAHYRLSQSLRALLGPDSGANFHTWATWGSKKAGRTIRQDDVPALRRLAGLAGGGLGLLAQAAVARSGAPRLGTAPGALLGAWSLQALAHQRLAHASRLILGGNRTVLDDMGRATARFLVACAGHPPAEARPLAAFLATLRPGPAARGGQILLRHAFTHYYQAGQARDRATRHEQMLLANLYAILHEHIRLQPYIAGAMPVLARRLITRCLLDFSIGRRTMRVSADVVPLGGEAALAHLENAELVRFLAGPGGWDRPPDSGRGSRARNWADLGERMHFISALFRTYHDDPDLFQAPYSAAQRAAIAAGRIPGGAL